MALVLFTFGILWFFTERNGLSAAFMMIVLVAIIEKLIHTTYTITNDGKLILYRGRFAKKIVLDIREINIVEKCTTMRIGKFYYTKYVLIQCAGEKCYTVEPIKEEEFLEALVKANPEIKQVN